MYAMALLIAHDLAVDAEYRKLSSSHKSSSRNGRINYGDEF